MKWLYRTATLKRGQTDDRLNELGRAGWECFSIVEGIGSSMIYTFKSPLGKGMDDAVQNQETGQADAGGSPRVQAHADQRSQQGGGPGVRRRGRPKGSKNKPKAPQALSQAGKAVEVAL